MGCALRCARRASGDTVTIPQLKCSGVTMEWRHEPGTSDHREKTDDAKRLEPAGACSVHYSAELIASWARSDVRDVNRWNSARKSLSTYVTTTGAGEAAFFDVGDDGYIDMMFVAPKFGRRGVADALLAYFRDDAVGAGVCELYTNASITARPFFEKHGFAVVAGQHPITLGEEIPNYKMMLRL